MVYRLVIFVVFFASFWFFTCPKSKLILQIRRPNRKPNVLLDPQTLTLIFINRIGIYCKHKRVTLSANVNFEEIKYIVVVATRWLRSI